MKPLRIAIGVTLLVILGGARPGRAAPRALPLEDYLKEVMRTNDAYRGALASSAGALGASREADLIYSPQLISHLEFVDDWRPTLRPELEGTSNLSKTFALGVSKLMDFGLRASLSLGVTSTILSGVDPTLVPNNGQVVFGPLLQLEQPLWQNAFGRMDRERKRALEAQDLSSSLASSYEAKLALADAEARYWRLAVAREALRIERESTARAASIRDFEAKRARRRLGDATDLLISEAAVQGKRLELQSAIDSEKAAARAFNSSRRMDADEVPETLTLPDPSGIARMAAPARAEMRDDVKAAQQAELATSANDEIAREQLLPTLNLVGTDYSVGLNLSIPLDPETASVRSAYAARMQGAELEYQRRIFDQDREWEDLTRKLAETRERLAIASVLRDAQKRKFEHVSRRKALGLTTAYQVFQFELDYLEAELTEVRLEGLALELVARMRAFGGDS